MLNDCMVGAKGSEGSLETGAGVVCAIAEIGVKSKRIPVRGKETSSEERFI